MSSIHEHGIKFLIQDDFDTNTLFPCGHKANQLTLIQSYQNGTFECACPETCEDCGSEVTYYAGTPRCDCSFDPLTMPEQPQWDENEHYQGWLYTYANPEEDERQAEARAFWCDATYDTGLDLSTLDADDDIPF